MIIENIQKSRNIITHKTVKTDYLFWSSVYDERR